MGRLGVNPELRYTKKQEPVCSLSIAVDQKDTDKPDWKRVIVWGNKRSFAVFILRKARKFLCRAGCNRENLKDAMVIKEQL